MDFFALQHWNFNGATVYAAAFDKTVEVTNVYPSARNDYISAASDPDLKRSRFAVWRLLERALHEKFGFFVADLDIVFDASGKWYSANGKACFSLSHSGDMIAVAVSDKPVGVDIQLADSFLQKNDAFARRILNETELTGYFAAPVESRALFLAEHWAAKECVFKLNGGGAFIPAKINTDLANVEIRLLEYGNHRYVAAVSTAK